MTHIYGHRWTATFGKSAVDANGDFTEIARTWATGLRDISGEQIAAGLHACCNDATNEWPSLPMFKAKCRPSVVMVEHSDMYKAHKKSLPEPDWRKAERNAKWIEAITELRGKLHKTAGDRDD